MSSRLARPLRNGFFRRFRADSGTLLVDWSAAIGMATRIWSIAVLGSQRAPQTDAVAASIVRYSAVVPGGRLSIFGRGSRVQVGVWRCGGALCAACGSHGMCWRMVGDRGDKKVRKRRMSFFERYHAPSARETSRDGCGKCAEWPPQNRFKLGGQSGHTKTCLWT